MSKIAQFDSKAAQPTAVIGWYDTDELEYPNLPAPSELIMLTDDEWNVRMDEPWYVQDGKLVPKPAPTAAQLLIDAQAVRIGIMESAYLASIQLPVAYMATTFQADAGSQDVLTKCLAAGSVPEGFFWLDVHNAQVLMTYIQLQGLAAAILDQGQAAFSRLQQLKSQVRAAETVAEVQAVVW